MAQSSGPASRNAADITQPAMPPLGLHLGKPKTPSQKDTWPQGSLQHNLQQLGYGSNPGAYFVIYIYNEHYSAIKNNEVLPFATA